MPVHARCDTSCGRSHSPGTEEWRHDRPHRAVHVCRATHDPARAGGDRPLAGRGGRAWRRLPGHLAIRARCNAHGRRVAAGPAPVGGQMVSRGAATVELLRPAEEARTLIAGARLTKLSPSWPPG